MSNASGQFAADLTIADGDENRVSQVTVFLDRAFVKRSAEADVVAGVNRVCVELQAHSVDSDSCQATVRGAGEILGVQYREVPVAKPPRADLRELEQQIEDTSKRRRPLVDELKVLDKQEQFLDAVNKLADVEIPKRMRTEFPSVENLAAMVEFVGGQQERIDARNREIKEQLDEINKQLDALKQRKKDLAPPKRPRRKAVEVLFKTDKAQRIGIEAAYLVHRAGWEPIYKVDVAAELDAVNLTMFAKIRQNSGEHWRDVALTVSNVMPMSGADLPDLESWIVRPRPVPKPITVRMASPGRHRAKAGAEEEDLGAFAGMAMAEAGDLAEGPPEAEFAEVEQRELPNAFEYELPASASIDADDAETLLPLFSRPLEGRFYHYAVPSVQPVAYLVCEAKATGELMAGTLNVYMAGRFLGPAHLAEKRSGEPLRVNLGPDRGVKLRRERPTDKAKQKFLGMDVGKITRGFEHRIIAENLKETPVRLEVLEAIPVAQTDLYKVKDVDLDPEPTEKDYDQREGVMRWVLDLGPGGTATIHTRFAVQYPRNKPPVL